MTTVRLGPPSPDDLAAQAKAWREREGLGQTAAAEILGLPQRTYQHLEQGRGFRYPNLLQTVFRRISFKGGAK